MSWWIFDELFRSPPSCCVHNLFTLFMRENNFIFLVAQSWNKIELDWRLMVIFSKDFIAKKLLKVSSHYVINLNPHKPFFYNIPSWRRTYKINISFEESHDARLLAIWWSMKFSFKNNFRIFSCSPWVCYVCHNKKICWHEFYLRKTFEFMWMRVCCAERMWNWIVKHHHHSHQYISIRR